MLYAIIAQDIDNSLEKRKLARPAHLQRLQELQNKGRLILAGPHPAIDAESPGDAGFSGSLIVAEFSDMEAAQRWANDDPFFKTGVYKSVITKPFKQVFPIKS